MRPTTAAPIIVASEVPLYLAFDDALKLGANSAANNRFSRAKLFDPVTSVGQSGLQSLVRNTARQEWKGACWAWMPL